MRRYCEIDLHNFACILMGWEWIDKCAGDFRYSGWSVQIHLEVSLFCYDIFHCCCCFYFKRCVVLFLFFFRPSETSYWLSSRLPILRLLLLPLLLGWFPNNTKLPSYHITSSIWPEVVRVCAWILQHLMSTSVLLIETLFSVCECVTSRVEEVQNWSTGHSGNIYLNYIYWVFDTSIWKLQHWCKEYVSW
jgi:hypothetical protein